jgi:LPS export ABC transporter permease LptG
MLRVIDRYLLRELGPPFLLGGALFTFFLFIDRIYHLTDLVITKGVPLRLVMGLLLYMLPSFLALTLPMALLAAILLACGRLAGDLEIVALRAAGVSPLRLWRPVALVAVVVAAITAWFTLAVNPTTNAAFQRQLFRILETRAASALKERVFNTAFAGVVVYIEELSPSQVALKGLLVSDERDPRQSRIITAREGRLLTDEQNRRITLRLIDGAISEGPVAAGPVTAPPPGSTGDGRPPARALSSTHHRFTAFSVDDMTLTIESPLKLPSRVDKPERDLSTRDLGAAIATLRGQGQPVAAYQVEYHKRFALPAAAIVFALVGFGLAVRSPRGGRSLAIVGSLVILVVYHLLLSFLERLALSLVLPPWLSVWLPNLIFTLVGVGILWTALRQLEMPELLWPGRLADRVRAARIAATPLRAAPVVRSPRASTHLIDRYLIREYLVYVVVGLAVAAVLFVIVDYLGHLDRYLRAKPPLIYIVQHFVYRLPAALYQGLPIVLLVATLFLFLTLSRQHELTALKAAGVSLYRVSLPILVLGALASVAAGLFQEIALPVLNERGEDVDRVKIRGQTPRHLQVLTRTWLRSSETRFFRVELIDPKERDMMGITILEIDRDFRLQSRLDSAGARGSEAGWEFTNGAVRVFSAHDRMETTPFTVTTLSLPERIDDFMEMQKSVEAMSFSELYAYVTRLQENGHAVSKYLVDLYGKLSFPFVNLVMVLVAIPLALHARPGGRVVGIGLAVAIMAGYFLVHYAARSFARADLLPPLIAACAANVVFLNLGLALLIRART